MKNLKWMKVDNVYLLTSSDSEVLIKLHFDLINVSSFEVNGESYFVKRKGFWNQRLSILHKDEEVVSVSHNFWGSKGLVRFGEGTSYQSHFKYKNILTLYLKDQESEILRYSVGGEPGKQFAEISIGIAIVDADKLLIMAGLGMIMFLNIFNEFNSGDDDGLIMLSVASTS